MKRNNKTGRGVESTRSLSMKYKGLYDRAVENSLSEFELKMFKAIEKSLGEQGYFDKKLNGPGRIRRHPIFWKGR